MTADAPQATQHVRQVTAEDAAVGVQLVDDDIAQVLKQLCPARVVRKDARMQHVGIAEHDMRASTNRAPRVLRGIAVVGEDADVLTARRRQRVRQLVQFRQLILRQRLGWKQVQRARRRVAKNRTEHWRVVAECLARGCRRGHDDMAAGERVRDRLSLVGIQLVDAASCQRLTQPSIDRLGKRRKYRRPRREPPDRRDPGIRRIGPFGDAPGQSVENGLQRIVVGRIRPLGRQHRTRS